MHITYRSDREAYFCLSKLSIPIRPQWLWNPFLPEYIEHHIKASVTVKPTSTWILSYPIRPQWLENPIMPECIEHPNTFSVTVKPISAWVHWASQYSLCDCETHFCLSTLSIPISHQWLGNPSGVDTSRYFEGAKTGMFAGSHKLDTFLNQMVNKMWSYGQIVCIKCLSYTKLKSITKK